MGFKEISVICEYLGVGPTKLGHKFWKIKYLNHGRQDNLAPVSPIEAVGGVNLGLKTVIDAGKFSVGNRKLQFGWA